jgi:hypothetical protein
MIKNQETRQIFMRRLLFINNFAVRKNVVSLLFFNNHQPLNSYDI